MPAGPAGKIFISYRRQETAWPARQLYEVLVSRFGAESVFKDVDDIDPGDDFVDRITEAVGACDVLLALIGPQWLAMTDDKGRRRLDNPDDFVRIELTAALSRGVRVVPILVDGARMPEAAELPGELASLTRRQAVEINPVGFNTDRLLATLATSLAHPTPADEPGVAQPGVEAPSPVPPAPAPAPPEEAAARASHAAPIPPTHIEPAPHLPADGGPDAPLAVPHRRTRSRPAILVGAAALALALILALMVWQPWRQVAATSTAPSPSPMAPTPVLTPSPGPSSTGAVAADLPNPPILAHRGGLEEHQFETQPAMESAARSGFAVETDVRYTSDGVAVLVHDEKATKGLDCGGQEIRVSQVTWAKLSSTCRSKPTAVDPTSYEVPRLDATLEGIAAASPTAWVFLEAKTDMSPARLSGLLAEPAKYGLADRTVFTSADRARLEAIRAADAGFRRMLFVSGTRIPAADLAADQLWAVAVEQGIADAGYVEALRAIGLRVMVWVPNDEKQWDRVSRVEPDLVMSDYPAKYQSWLAGR